MSKLGRTLEDFIGDTGLVEEDAEEKTSKTGTSNENARWSVGDQRREIVVVGDS
jgi:hypothetical protein